MTDKMGPDVKLLRDAFLNPAMVDFLKEKPYAMLGNSLGIKILFLNFIFFYGSHSITRCLVKL